MQYKLLCHLLSASQWEGANFREHRYMKLSVQAVFYFILTAQGSLEVLLFPAIDITVQLFVAGNKIIANNFATSYVLSLSFFFFFLETFIQPRD